MRILTQKKKCISEYFISIHSININLDHLDVQVTSKQDGLKKA